jgi:branched-subunit amino acid transport protein
MLTALVVPMIATVPGGTAVPKIVAALVAAAVAFRTHSTLKTLGAGMATLWALQALASRIG